MTIMYRFILLLVVMTISGIFFGIFESVPPYAPEFAVRKRCAQLYDIGFVILVLWVISG